MRKLIAMVAMCVFMLSGCSSVPSQQGNPAVEQAKAFIPAPEGKGYVYVFRDGWFARLLSKEIYLDDKSLGDSDNKTFFLLKLDAGKHYKLGADSEFGNNEVDVTVESGKTYYFRHYTRMGIMFGTQADFDAITSPDDIADAQESIKVSRMNNPEKG
ncbi:DUF2846 domain-containing protein [Aeromonas popoffii]|uniref:DUF2846 domain-containing protein n=1 Tax=Aeromonas popoffii TaxID=70856 RepID=UPI0005AA0093|nr:DUF2846 domain-containing protein [Aeromonas popoffii]